MLGCKLSTNRLRDDAGRVKVGVRTHHTLDGFEVSYRWSVSAAYKGLAMTSETSLDHRDHFVPEVSEPSSSTCFIKLTTDEGGLEPAGVLGLKVLDKVDERVYLPGDLRVRCIVSKADA